MGYILFHVPHSSLKMPKIFNRVKIENIDSFNYLMCDLFTDKLVPLNSSKLLFKYSRVFCDVEKFNSEKETMNRYGMGVIYTNDLENKITNISNKYKNKVIKSYYNKHHNKLDKMVSDRIRKYNKCLIIDLHSYSDYVVNRLFNYSINPDICIGVDNYFTPKWLIDLTIKHFTKYGYSIKINYPYEGTIIPNKYYNKKDNRVISIMLEINKRIYINDYSKIKDIIFEYYNLLK